MITRCGISLWLSSHGVFFFLLLMCRVVFDMSEERCFYGFSPSERGQRPVSRGFGGVNRLQRWSTSDPALAFDKICPA